MAESSPQDPFGNGPGKYDAEATFVRERTDAAGVVLIVIQGNLGNGFEVQAPAAVLFELPDTLEALAAQIRAQLPPR